MQSFIVMQGQTYQEEKELGMIWSRKQASDGSFPHSWLRVMEVNEGNRIFHYVKGSIVAISVAKTGCQIAQRPSSEPNDDSGYLVELDYHELEVPVNVRAKFDAILPLLPIKYSPFQADANGNQGYLYPCNEELTIKLLEMISDLNIYQVDEEQLELAISTVRQTERNTFIPMLAETETEVKTKIRLGRKSLDKVYYQCGLKSVRSVRLNYLNYFTQAIQSLGKIVRMLREWMLIMVCYFVVIIMRFMKMDLSLLMDRGGYIFRHRFRKKIMRNMVSNLK